MFNFSLMAQNIKMRKIIITFFFFNHQNSMRHKMRRNKRINFNPGKWKDEDIKEKPPQRLKKIQFLEMQQINSNHMNGMSKSGYSRKMFF